MDESAPILSSELGAPMITCLPEITDPFLSSIKVVESPFRLNIKLQGEYRMVVHLILELSKTSESSVLYSKSAVKRRFLSLIVQTLSTVLDVLQSLSTVNSG